MQYAGPPLIAVADDDEMHAEVVCAVLGSLGYAVRCFTTGDALLEWARDAAEVPAAVLLDVEMPGSDGFEVCAALRTLHAYAEIPCVFVSSLAADTLADGARAAGGSGSMRKDASLLPRLAAWLQHAVPVSRLDTSSRIPAAVLQS
jgi:CheY-like chemotaxis protein